MMSDWTNDFFITATLQKYFTFIYFFINFYKFCYTQLVHTLSGHALSPEFWGQSQEIFQLPFRFFCVTEVSRSGYQTDPSLQESLSMLILYHPTNYIIIQVYTVGNLHFRESSAK